MKIDFRKIEIKDINGNVSVIDLSKELGNLIYKNTPDLGELEFAQELYKNGEVEVDESKAESNTNKEKLGAEFPFTRFFYEYKEPEKADDLLAEFMEIEKTLADKIKSLTESEVL